MSNAEQAQNTRFSYYTYDFKITQNLLREENYSDNQIVATMQKIVKFVGAVVVGALESLKNGAKFAANCALFLANLAHEGYKTYFQNRKIAAVNPAPSCNAAALNAAPCAACIVSAPGAEPGEEEVVHFDAEKIVLVEAQAPAQPAVAAVQPAPLSSSSEAPQQAPVIALVQSSKPQEAPAAAELPAVEAVEKPAIEENELEEDAAPIEEKSELSETEEDEDSKGIEIEVPKELADEIFKRKSEAPSYGRFDPRRVFQWFRKTA